MNKNTDPAHPALHRFLSNQIYSNPFWNRIANLSSWLWRTVTKPWLFRNKRGYHLICPAKTSCFVLVKWFHEAYTQYYEPLGMGQLSEETYRPALRSACPYV